MNRRVILFVMAIAALTASAAQGQLFKPEDYTAGRLALLNLPANEETPPTVPVRPDDKAFCCEKKYFGIAAAEIIAVEILPWYFNRHVADDTTAALSWKAWKHNIRSGLEWDPNNFKTNLFMHPFHGNVYYNVGRSNGYDYWGSSAFAFAGSMIWEMFGENNLGAINDWAMTSLGGITIGEGLHRAATMLRDNTATGSGRAFRELGAFLFDPVGGFNRAARGEFTKVGPNPVDRFPTTLRTDILLGGRAVGESRLRNAGKPSGFAHIGIHYGNPMEDHDRPFDAFDLTIQANGRTEKARLGLLQVHGVIYGAEMKNTDKVHRVFTIDQMFDYSNNNTYEVGGQSFAFSIRNLSKLSERTAIHTTIQPSVYVMTGIISDSTLVGLRDYDFGAGLGFRFIADYMRSGYSYIRVGYRGIFSHTLNGTAGNQIVHFVFTQFRYPLSGSVGIGLEYLLYMRNSFYRDFDSIHRQDPELRLGLTFEL